LIYEAYQSPLSQPRNVFGSYAISSFIGVSIRQLCDLIGIPRYITAALAVCFSLLAMNLTKTVHPPGLSCLIQMRLQLSNSSFLHKGGACALISVIGGKMVEDLGYGFMATSVGAAIIMVAIAVLGNNLTPTRQYPLYWY
jgi:CBS domain-containing membrane protein